MPNILNAYMIAEEGRKNIGSIVGILPRREGFVPVSILKGEIKLSTYILLSKFQVQ